MSDLWGADGTQGSNAMWPGDGGSYTEYDRFLTQLVADLKANGMTTSIKLLIWNEPDLASLFWAPGEPVDQGAVSLDRVLKPSKGLSRYLDMWSHTVKFLRCVRPLDHFVGC